MATLATILEQIFSLGIFLIGAALAILSWLAYRRERDQRMRIVTVAYALFAAYGLAVFVEYYVLGFISARTAELIEHGAAVFILIALLMFFVALTRE